MNKTKKIITSSIIITGLLVTASANAMLETTSDTNSGSSDKESREVRTMDVQETKAKNEEFKKKREAILKKRKELEENRSDRKEFVGKSRDEMKVNLKEFRSENGKKIKESFKSLDKEVKSELKKSRNSFKEESKDLISKLKDKSISFQDKIEIRNKLEDLRSKYYTSLKDNLSTNTDALDLIEKRKEVFEANKNIRSDITEKRKEFREKRSDIIVKYKKLIINKVGDRIDKMSAKNLEKLTERVNKMYEKIDSNTKISAEKKENILTLLEWLLDTIKEKSQIIEAQDDEMDIVDEVLE